MSTDWHSLILGTTPSNDVWAEIYAAMLALSKGSTSPVALHDATVIPDRLLSEAAWELWEAYPHCAATTADTLKRWAVGSGKAVLILDALSLRELPLLLAAADARNIQPTNITVTGSACPSTTDHFAQSLGINSRSALANDAKPAKFSLFGGNCYTDVLNLPFEDCTVPPTPNLVIWHSWLDDLIHAHKLPDLITKHAVQTLQSDGFWSFINRLRQGRSLILTSDHGYAVSKRFSSEVEDPHAIALLRTTFSASRCKPVTETCQPAFMPPVIMTFNDHHVVMGQRKWKVQGGFPAICHGGMSLLEVLVPFVEFPAL